MPRPRPCTPLALTLPVCTRRGPERVLEGRRRPVQQLQQRLLELERPQRPVQPVHTVAAAVRRLCQALPQPGARRRHRRSRGWQPALRRAHPQEKKGEPLLPPPGLPRPGYARVLVGGRATKRGHVSPEGAGPPPARASRCLESELARVPQPSQGLGALKADVRHSVVLHSLSSCKIKLIFYFSPVK